MVAGCGVAVAKHGNRAMSSKAGTADVLQALGVNLDAEIPLVEKALREANVGFMLAPRHHGAMRHVGPTRLELGTRTIFNLLGPLSNPAGVKRQMVGVFSPEWVDPVAATLMTLGAEHAWVVHGDGYDEITTTGETTVAEISGGRTRTFSLAPEAVGLKRRGKDELRGGDAAFNASAMRALLAGAIGLIAVLLYCLIYYRLLGVLTALSLVLSGVVVYGMIVLLGRSIGFTLDLAGIAVSTGSACSSGTLEPSHVLKAMGFPVHRTQNSIRFSLGAANTEADIQRALEVLPGVVEKLRNLTRAVARV